MNRFTVCVGIALWVTLSLGNTLSAETSTDTLSCGNLVGENVTPISVHDAIAPYTEITPKDEFETTATYDERIAKIVAKAPSRVIIGNRLKADGNFAYDADKQSLRVQLSDFGSISFGGSLAFGFGFWVQAHIYGPTTDSGFLTLTDREKRGVIVSKTNNPMETYIGENAFGAKITVQKEVGTATVIFDSEQSHLFSTEYKFFANHNILDEVSLSPQEAKKLKPLLNTAFVVEPVAPYGAKGQYRLKPKVDFPFDRTTRYTVLIAKFHCALLLDGDNTVLRVYNLTEISAPE